MSLIKITSYCFPKLITTKTPRFQLKGKYHAKVVDVYDGDTCQIIIWLGCYGPKRFTLRIEGIDTPEMKGGTEETKQLAIIARDHLRGLILDKHVIVYLNGFEKYGRLLGNIFVNESINSQSFYVFQKICFCNFLSFKEINISEHMVSEGYAKEYFGGSKT